MLLNVKVIPNASKSRVCEEKDLIKVYVKSPPVDGKANKELIEVLAEHFSIKKDQISIIHGEKSRTKVINVAKL